MTEIDKKIMQLFSNLSKSPGSSRSVIYRDEAVKHVFYIEMARVLPISERGDLLFGIGTPSYTHTYTNWPYTAQHSGLAVNIITPYKTRTIAAQGVGTRLSFLLMRSNYFETYCRAVVADILFSNSPIHALMRIPTALTLMRHA